MTNFKGVNRDLEHTRFKQFDEKVSIVFSIVAEEKATLNCYKTLFTFTMQSRWTYLKSILCLKQKYIFA